jgi:hypothetical protein
MTVIASRRKFRFHTHIYLTAEPRNPLGGCRERFLELLLGLPLCSACGPALCIRLGGSFALIAAADIFLYHSVTMAMAPIVVSRPLRRFSQAKALSSSLLCYENVRCAGFASQPPSYENVQTSDNAGFASKR